MSYCRLRTRFSCLVIQAALPVLSELAAMAAMAAMAALAALAALAAIIAWGPVPLAAQEPPPPLPTLLAWQSPPAGACVPSRNVGCSNHGRFSVAVTWQNQFNNTSGKGVVVATAS